MEPLDRTLPLLLSPKVMYSLEHMGVRLENHLELLIMWHEHPESTSHVFSRPPTYISKSAKDEQMAQHWG